MYICIIIYTQYANKSLCNRAIEIILPFLFVWQYDALIHCQILTDCMIYYASYDICTKRSNDFCLREETSDKCMSCHIGGVILFFIICSFRFLISLFFTFLDFFIFEFWFFFVCVCFFFVFFTLQSIVFKMRIVCLLSLHFFVLFLMNHWKGNLHDVVCSYISSSHTSDSFDLIVWNI